MGPSRRLSHREVLVRSTRRSFLERAISVIVFSALPAPTAMLACSNEEPLCADPELLSTAERSLRRTRGYVEVSVTRAPDGSLQSCSGCQFFQRESEAVRCGHCKILSGPVSATGHCDAWASRQVG